MKKQLQDKKVKIGITIMTVVAGTVSGLVFSKMRNKRKDKY